MKRILGIRLVVLGLFFSMLLAACGDPSPSATSSATTTNSPTTVAATTVPVTTAPVITPSPTAPVSTTAATTATPTAQDIAGLVDVGGFKLFISCTGVGSPTVILDTGAADDSSVWSAVQSQVAQFTRVCRYDRGNLGKSEQATTPRTSQQMVKELKTLLTNSQVKGPYLIVGHSLGGLNMQLYASQYPNEIAGVVLVESMHVDQFARFDKALTKEQAAIINDFTGNPEKMTYENFKESVEQARTAAKFPPVPLIVLTRGWVGMVKPPESYWPTSLGDPFPELENIWRELQADLVKLSPKGKQVIAEKSDHSIPLRQPELITQSIQELIKQG
ncbi:MAG: alpha/beta hydrolase [Chloroflexi bacterium]|uniref:Alpha/beta hydrolase n=1 Tax=Candidatus Chlorohelix allophototropha TaxID=3003348 RepID=A0A8T7LSI8_9CHLR|nr:alpha/beta hydrolase [Chloroflexota bacterium]WJW66869.1 alpha/beta hydrolase [Chloroflexota bacterium L227-S17]